MSTGLDRVRDVLVEYLKAGGLEAVSAWSETGSRETEGPVVAVSMRGCQAEKAGLFDYLGERYNQDTARWEEVYGRKMQVKFALDIYADGSSGEEELEQTFLTLAHVLARGGPEGLTVEEISCGATMYDGGERVLKREAEALCKAYLYAVAEPGGAFLDFEIKGGIRQ